MAYQEYVQKAIATGKAYDELPAKVKGAVPLQEWKTRVRELCVQQGAAWDSSQACYVCNELEYYEALIATYKAWGRLYPYHLAEYVARVFRVTPFRYYIDLLFLCLKEERSYDRIPNFTAADVLRLTGVGRNEYIALLNTCKSKRLLWRLNKGIARELLPQAPPDIRLEHWWKVAVVNVGESEFRDLSGPESSLLRAAADGPTPLSVGACDPALLQQLYKKGLVYLIIPVAPEDRFSIPPLEGFVSNKTSEAGDDSVDPFEPLLYRLFLANSSRLDQARLADILGTDLQQLQLATALAVRLGFATRLNNNTNTTDELSAAAAAVGTPRVGSSSSIGGLLGGVSGRLLGSSGTPLAAAGSSGSTAAVIFDSLLEDTAAAAAAGGREGVQEGGVEADGVWGVAAAGAAEGEGGGGGGLECGGGAVAVVVDAETTSCLMMGALSAGLKRHSVSLFEGGRVSGQGVMDELIGELNASAAAGALFEGEDFAQLLRVIESLGVLLGCVRSAVAAQGQTLELLRQESFAGLDPLSAAKVLAATYTAILPISPLPGHTLPRLLAHQLQQPPPHTTNTIAAAEHPDAAGGSNPTTTSSSSSRPVAPTFFGPPSPEADSPWLQLALYAAAGAGPVSLVFVAGSRVWRLPPQLQGATHALLWGWGPAAAAAASATGGGGSGADTRPLLVEGSNLLCTLNELLSRTAVMVQPLVTLDQLPAPTAAVAAATTAAASQDSQHLVRFVDVPLPLVPSQDSRANPAAAAAAGEGGAGGITGPLSSAAAAASGLHLGGGPEKSVQQQQQVDNASGWEAVTAAAATAAAALGSSLSGGVLQSPLHTLSTPKQQQQQQQQQGSVLVQAVERTGAAAGSLRELLVPSQVVSALSQLQLSGAVGWLRLVRLPPTAAAAAAAASAASAGSHPVGTAATASAGAAPGPHHQQQPWLPLSVHLGVPLFCPALCRAVCSNMAQQQCLSQWGQAAWTVAQQQLQHQLADAVGLADSSSSSSIVRAHSISSGTAAAASGVSDPGGPVAGRGSGGGGGGVGGGMVGGGVQLPGHCLLFDGHSLLPVDVSSCLQGMQCW